MSSRCIAYWRVAALSLYHRQVPVIEQRRRGLHRLCSFVEALICAVCALFSRAYLSIVVVSCFCEVLFDCLGF